MPLDSDVQNADANLYVEFYECKREPYVGEAFVRIMNPGDKTNVYDQPATEEHKLRFPRHWLHYQSKQAGESGAAFGTTLAQWVEDMPGDLSSGQISELGILGFQTAEQVAGASDAQVQRVGMGGAGLREKARAYLARKNRSSTDAALEAANARADRLEAQMAELMASLANPEKRGPGRPRKDTADGLVHADAGDSSNL
jgi:hypothetical protein